MKKLIVKQEFKELFKPILENENITRKGSEYSLFSLPIQDSELNYNDLIDYLTELIPEFVFSKKTCDEYKSDRKLCREARKKIIQYSDFRKKAALGEKPSEDELKNYHNGELGEMLLYCFLEGIKKAPKIFSKYELKTSGQMPVHGSDGVHLLKIDENNYEFIFGEAKMKKVIKESAREAVKSIKEFKSRKEDNIYSEIQMITSNLNKELDSKQEEILREALIPKKDIEIKLNNSFGIFLGFDLEKLNLDKDYPDEEYEEMLFNQLKDIGIDNIKYLKDIIKEKKLLGHKFYIYAIPFENLQHDRNILLEMI